MQKILLVILIVALAIVLFFYKKDRDSYTAETTRNKIDIDNLEKNLSETNYNYGFAIAKCHCWTCHKFNYATDNLLEGVVQNRGEKYLSLYLTRQDSLITANDPIAVSLKKKYGNMGNSHNFEFSQSDLKALMEFMK